MAGRALGIALACLTGIPAATRAQDLPPDYPRKPVVRLTAQPYMPVLHPSVPASSVKELVAYAYFAPAGTPMSIVRTINGIVSAGMNAPEILKAVAADGSEVAAPESPEAFKAELDREYAEIEQTVKAANIQLK
jgi:tripartite-type tricarboxylate transporter receptor subunit TctC